ncbi:MAG: hypothetical protein PHS92_02810 [Candidatus Gracilibacteria bacterium]|nr:hypothetical protein [Candidatus Gracilibacteria bacterium]
MKKTFSILTVFILFLSNISTIFAATTTPTATTTSKSTGKVDHFEISTSPATTKIGEAVDLTVKAVDSSGNQIKDYVGTIYITVDNDTKATVPYSDGYQFLPADLGSKTFSKGLSFTKEGKMKIVVMDIDNENLEGTVDVDVAATSQTTSTKGEITITSPDNGVMLAGDKVTVSGSTKKNSKIQYFLNLKKVYENQTDNDGNFSYELTGLTQSENVINVKVLDSSDSIIAESDKIIVKQEVSGPVYKNISVKEGKEVGPGTQISVEVMADPALTEVTASLGDFSQALKEGTPGSYTGTLTVPAEFGDYMINVSLKSALGKVTTKNNIYAIKVLDQNIFKDVKTQLGDKKVTFTFTLNPDKDEVSKFKFKYGTGTDSLTGEAITFEKSKIKDSSGALSWYIPNLEISKYYFQIIPLNGSGEELGGKSEIIDADLSLASAGKCSISNIAGLKATKKGDVSELTWDTATEATSYNIYKKGEDGKFVLIENVKTNSYMINISGDKVKYEDFAIKGICGDQDNQGESADYSNVTKVQTGPVQIIALIFLSFVIGFLYIRRKRFN